ncbi:PREDICTED: probable elongator complex protein 2 [Amphimedon queenslandica]|uniref:Elongator complex protein 2 n=2 Tax=Amphimedon queenslandica TaxID=400682 RepID=A0AAN0JLQ3_AMPQE|nr:PREDICTED: probable elongator complex protein 2 [Amphimedon queenslandica]|eukprot:XP_019857686.1 PREDICTED: probable elongator complex protein 2 [Amphimedon queenslandica]
MAISLEYCSVSCNRTPHAINWEPSGDRLAFATDKSIAIAETIQGGTLYVKHTLHGHNEKVNCVRWVAGRGGRVDTITRELISGSVDKTIRVWRESNNEFECIDVLTSHTDAVTCLTVDRTHKGVWVFSTGSDSNVMVWLRSRDEDKFSLCQTISFGRGFVFSLDSYQLPGASTNLLLACGGDDGKISCFAQENDKFIKVITLSGHTDWIRDVSITEDASDVLIASSSQDTYIRLWRLKEEDHETQSGNGEKLSLKGNKFKIHMDSSCKSSTDGNTTSTESSSGRVGCYSVTLEAVLCGHDDWVYSCRWSPAAYPSEPLSLLSASMDKTMILWRVCPDSGVWLEQVRLGDVGGNSLGLYGGIFGKGSDTVLAHGYQGSLHLWRRVQSRDGGTTELWQPLASPSGHFGSVEDCCWDPEGRYLLSVGSDQSTRLHAPWRRGRREDKDEVSSWHELARPQIHGYDMTCITSLSPLLIATGADEKVLRVFAAPRNFIDNLSRVSGVTVKDSGTRVGGDVPLGASIPALGLSNKAVFTTASYDKNETDLASAKNSFSSEVPVFSDIELSGPPIEEHLLQNTLWPETQKLYGHSYELYSIASNGRYIASACKASQAEYASIRIWDSLSWMQVALLTKHSLTVTQLSFSHSGNRLLAVSRDRLWSLWQFDTLSDGGATSDERLSVNCVSVMDKNTKAHTRIIWSCSWSHDDVCFATASRDRKVCIWSDGHSVLDNPINCGGGWTLAAKPFELSQSVTAIDFAPFSYQKGKYVLAAGLETGSLSLLSFSIENGAWSELAKLHPFMCHTSTVRRIQWQPGGSEDDCLLATCSTDQSLRLFRVNLGLIQSKEL